MQALANFFEDGKVHYPARWRRQGQHEPARCPSMTKGLPERSGRERIVPSIGQQERKAQFDLRALEERLGQQSREKEEQLRREMQDLSLRIASIERRIGSDRSFFDVRKLYVERQELGSLPRERYRSFLGGSFFVVPPGDSSWQQDIGSEAKTMVGSLGPWLQKVIVGLPAQLRHNFEQSRGVLWTGPAMPVVQHRSKMLGEVLELELRPVLYVAPVSHQFVAERTRLLLEALTGRRQGAAEVGDAAPADDPASREALRDALRKTRTDEASPEIQQFMDNLAASFRGDIAAFFLVDALMNRFQRSTVLFAPSSFEINSAQKVGNVFYVRLRTVIDVDGGAGGATVDKLYMDEEIFFLSRPGQQDSLLITTFLPSADGNPPDRDWVARWLATLQVPL